MTDEVKEAIRLLRNLPDDKRHTVARAILDYASDYERAQVRAGVAEIEHGDIASTDHYQKSVRTGSLRDRTC